MAVAEAVSHDRIDRVDVDGTALQVRLNSGRILQGRDLEGATLAIVLPGKRQPQRIRIDSIAPDPMDPEGEILLYRIRVLDSAPGKSEELCGPDPQGERWAFPLRGQWDSNGSHISDEGFTLTCSSGAQGKCLRFGYKPWRSLPDGVSLADYHQACIRLVRAAYCRFHGTTRDGVQIDIYDRVGIQGPADGAIQKGLHFEAAWNAKGAVCVSHTRVPAKMTLKRLGEVCPRLRGYLGKAACTAERAESGELGAVLLYNRSR